MRTGWKHCWLVGAACVLCLAGGCRRSTIAPVPPQPASEYLTTTELNAACGVPGQCGQPMACEGREYKVRGYVDPRNIFDKQHYPQLTYEKFILVEGPNSNTIHNLDVFTVAADNQAIFDSIYKYVDSGKQVYLRCIVRGFDAPANGNCSRLISLEIDSTGEFYFQ